MSTKFCYHKHLENRDKNNSCLINSKSWSNHQSNNFVVENNPSLKKIASKLNCVLENRNMFTCGCAEYGPWWWAGPLTYLPGPITVVGCLVSYNCMYVNLLLLISSLPTSGFPLYHTRPTTTNLNIFFVILNNLTISSF